MKIDEKIALTGPQASLGRELAKRFARAGAHVLIADIDAGGAESVAALVRAEGRYAWPVLVDLCDDQQVEALVAKAEALGGPHILVNNAGGWGTGDHQFPLSPDAAQRRWSRDQHRFQRRHRIRRLWLTGVRRGVWAGKEAHRHRYSNTDRAAYA